MFVADELNDEVNDDDNVLLPVRYACEGFILTAIFKRGNYKAQCKKIWTAESGLRKVTEEQVNSKLYEADHIISAAVYRDAIVTFDQMTMAKFCAIGSQVYPILNSTINLCFVLPEINNNKDNGNVGQDEHKYLRAMKGQICVALERILKVTKRVVGIEMANKIDYKLCTLIQQRYGVECFQGE